MADAIRLALAREFRRCAEGLRAVADGEMVRDWIEGDLSSNRSCLLESARILDIEADDFESGNTALPEDGEG